MRAKLPGLTIDSAGTGGWHIGNPPHPPAIKAAAARGYDLSALRARQVQQSDFQDFDLILAMDDDNLSDLRAMAPDANVQLFRAPTGGGAVPDPYYTGQFNHALDLIEEAAEAWVQTLNA